MTRSRPVAPASARSSFVCIALLATVFPIAEQPAVAVSVPNPKVTGPIPANAQPGDPSHDYPFFSTTVDLASKGYVEEEFFFEGTANRYRTPAGATGAIIDSGHSYRTRMIVRRPTSRVNFNGTVLMEWLNVSNNYDFDGLWIASYEHLMRRGYAWVGISAQRAGIHDPATGLRTWNSRRYSTLDVTENGNILDDALCYDIFSQAAQAVRNPNGVDPMGGLAVKRVLGIGVSQSASFLRTYHNSIHPIGGVLDALFLVGTAGPAAFRTDLEIKVFKLVSETDLMFAQAANRQADSDHLRRWEAAGVSHVDLHEAQSAAPAQERDLGPAAPRPPECDLPPFSRIPAYFALNAAYDHLDRWVKDNVQPPSAPEIEVLSIGPPVVIARDAYGNALGGIRLSQHAVPTGTNTGVNSGPGSCSLAGSFQPFDAATLTKLYPDHLSYVAQVIESTLANLRAGFILPEDAATTISDAAYSDIGGH